MPHAVAYTLGPGVVRGRDVVLVGGSERPDYCRIHKGRVQMLVVYNVTLFARQIRPCSPHDRSKAPCVGDGAGTRGSEDCRAARAGNRALDARRTRRLTVDVQRGQRGADSRRSQAGMASSVVRPSLAGCGHSRNSRSVGIGRRATVGRAAGGIQRSARGVQERRPSPARISGWL